MKRLFYLLFLSVFSLTSCKKKYCWQCTTETTGGGTIAPTLADYCDMTESEIKQKEGTRTAEVTYGVKTITVTTNTVCKKKE